MGLGRIVHRQPYLQQLFFNIQDVIVNDKLVKKNDSTLTKDDLSEKPYCYYVPLATAISQCSFLVKLCFLTLNQRHSFTGSARIHSLYKFECNLLQIM